MKGKANVYREFVEALEDKLGDIGEKEGKK